MAMSSLSQAFLAAMLLSFLLGASCINTATLSSSQQNLAEDKTRLGSTPPNCHNRCNECNPCTAVQVPTLPGRAKLGFGRLARPADDSLTINQYSNYKPLGWKCRCGGHLYNP